MILLHTLFRCKCQCCAQLLEEQPHEEADNGLEYREIGGQHNDRRCFQVILLHGHPIWYFHLFYQSKMLRKGKITHNVKGDTHKEFSHVDGLPAMFSLEALDAINHHLDRSLQNRLHVVKFIDCVKHPIERVHEAVPAYDCAL